MFNWTDASLAKLKVLWEQGYHRNVIAEKIGCSPNAVSGMVHRRDYERIIDVRTRRALEASDQPGPVIPQPEVSPPAPEPVVPEPSPAPEVEPVSPPEVEPLPSVEPVLPQPIAATPKPRSRPVPQPVNDDIAPLVVPTHERITTSPYAKPVVSPRAKEWIYRGLRECAYPVGDPSRPAHQECCGNKTVPGKSYCAGHLAVMFPERKAIRSASRPFVPKRAAS